MTTFPNDWFTINKHNTITNISIAVMTTPEHAVAP